MLMVSEYPPVGFCPSMSAESVAQYIRYKRNSSATRLTSSTGAPVSDVLGRPMMCTGGWKDPGNVNQFLSAISIIHAERGQRGAYFEKCDACAEADRNGQFNYMGCKFHRGSPNIWRKGKPRDSKVTFIK